ILRRQRAIGAAQRPKPRTTLFHLIEGVSQGRCGHLQLGSPGPMSWNAVELDGHLGLHEPIIPPMHKVLLVIGDAAEVFDTMYPLHRIREDGYQVVVAGPEKRIYHLVQHDTHPDWNITVESPGYKLAADISFRDIRADDYAALVISGGRAP